jgi:hypothetical protein
MAFKPFNEFITFSRGTQATVVDATGKITYAPNNLAVGSEQFDGTAWTKTGVTVTANATTAPNGTITADKLVENTDVVSAHFVTMASSPSLATGQFGIYSAYVKAAERTFFQLILTGIGPAGVFLAAGFDLTTGTAGVVTATATSTITSVGDGWYRCTIMAPAATASVVGGQIRLAAAATGTAAATYTGDGTSGLFVWGAQFEQVTYQTQPSTYNSTTPANLLGFTQEFNNSAWTKTNSTIATNVAIAPDGTLSADKHIPNNGATLGSGASETRVYQSPTLVIGSTYTYSIYAKAGEFDQIELSAIATPSQTARFSLTLGTVVSGSGANKSITYVGNGWYRCAFTLTSGQGSGAQIRWSAETSAGLPGDGTSGIFVWGAQLSNSGSLDPYVYNPGAIPSSTAYYGPRFDYDPITLAPKGLLLEEQRVNVVLQSQNFSDAAWIPARATSTADVTTSPDGTTNADRITADGTSGNHNMSQNVTYTAAAHTISVYAKKDTNDFVQLRFATAAIAGGTGFANFDLNAGTVGTIGAGLSAASITPAGNGWYRCTITGTTLAVATNFAIYIVSSASATSAQTNTLATSIFLYGAQLERDAFVTSYIPTVASTVTRAADSASMTGANFLSWYNASEGTIVVSGDSSRGGVAGTTRNFLFVDSTSNNIIRSNGTSTLQVVDGGVTQATIAATPSIPFDGTVYKFASAYRLNDFATVTTGAVVTDTSGTVPTGMNQLVLGGGSSTTILNGHVRNIIYYPTRSFTDAQLQALIL